MMARLGRAFGSLVALGAAAYLLSWGTAAPVAAVRRADTTFDDLLVLLAAGAGWLVLGWLVAVAACTAVAATSGVLGRAATRAAGRIAPAAARRLVAVAIGLSVAAGPTAACSTGPEGQLASAAEVVTAEQIDPSTLPSVGRPGQPVVPPGLDASGSSPLQTPVEAPTGTPAEVPGADGEVQPTASSISPPRDQDAVTTSAGLTIEPSREHPPGASEIVVHRGDSLWTIVARHLGPDATASDVAAEWPRWHAANHDVVGDDPDLILPGMVLRPPAS